MTTNSNDFIGVYENAFTKEYCDSVINYFDGLEQGGFVKNRQQVEGVSKLNKDDSLVFLTDSSLVNEAKVCNLAIPFNKLFWENWYPQYASVYTSLNEAGQHGLYELKVQKTSVGGGYHMWHAEATTRQTCNRLLAFILYLNDVEEGGETEFLYQHKRVSPKAGTLVIFPASFTHTHRGNPPLSNDKYIITGWVEL